MIPRLSILLENLGLYDVHFCIQKRKSCSDSTAGVHGDGKEDTGFSQLGQSPGKQSWAERDLLKFEMHRTIKDLILPVSFPWEGL